MLGFVRHIRRPAYPVFVAGDDVGVFQSVLHTSNLKTHNGIVFGYVMHVPVPNIAMAMPFLGEAYEDASRPDALGLLSPEPGASPLWPRLLPHTFQDEVTDKGIIFSVHINLVHTEKPAQVNQIVIRVKPRFAHSIKARGSVFG